ncbi:MAG: hypothetical protein OXL36_22345 [Bryobacterales bacterium]|nr:hypothetical protein [Bryobacterales bacterium]
MTPAEKHLPDQVTLTPVRVFPACMIRTRAEEKGASQAEEKGASQAEEKGARNMACKVFTKHETRNTNHGFFRASTVGV